MTVIPMELLERNCHSALEKVETLADEKFSIRERAIFSLGYGKGLSDSNKFISYASKIISMEDGQ